MRNLITETYKNTDSSNKSDLTKRIGLM